jgi:hypothetical protein
VLTAAGHPAAVWSVERITYLRDPSLLCIIRTLRGKATSAPVCHFRLREEGSWCAVPNSTLRGMRAVTA